MGEAIPGPRPFYSFSTFCRRISCVAEDEVRRKKITAVRGLGKLSFVPKAILHW